MYSTLLESSYKFIECLRIIMGKFDANEKIAELVKDVTKQLEQFNKYDKASVGCKELTANEHVAQGSIEKQRLNKPSPIEALEDIQNDKECKQNYSCESRDKPEAVESEPSTRVSVLFAKIQELEKFKKDTGELLQAAIDDISDKCTSLINVSDFQEQVASQLPFNWIKMFLKRDISAYVILSASIEQWGVLEDIISEIEDAIISLKDLTREVTSHSHINSILSTKSHFFEHNSVFSCEEVDMLEKYVANQFSALDKLVLLKDNEMKLMYKCMKHQLTIIYEQICLTHDSVNPRLSNPYSYYADGTKVDIKALVLENTANLSSEGGLKKCAKKLSAAIHEIYDAIDADTKAIELSDSDESDESQKTDVVKGEGETSEKTSECTNENQQENVSSVEHHAAINNKNATASVKFDNIGIKSGKIVTVQHEKELLLK